MSDMKKIVVDGLWKNNPATVQLLGLCPLLAVTGSVVNALGLGFATILVLVGSNLAVSLIRNYVSEAVRLPAFVMIIASFTTCVELLMQAFTYELYQILGIFIPLIVTNCAILGRAESFASKNTWLPSVVDGLASGAGFTLALVVLGGCRELIGSGTLFANASLLLGQSFSVIELDPMPEYKGLLLIVLPSGGFIMLGLLLSGKRLLELHRQRANTTATV
mgnify:CR=1 FL=1